MTPRRGPDRMIPRRTLDRGSTEEEEFGVGKRIKRKPRKYDDYTSDY